jgi:hypothetical protein
VTEGSPLTLNGHFHAIQLNSPSVHRDIGASVGQFVISDL